MLSHDRHISIKLWSVDHSPLFDYGVRPRALRAMVHSAQDLGTGVVSDRVSQPFEPLEMSLQNFPWAQ